MNTAAAARVVGIAPKDFRAFLRKSKLGVGAGSQYDFSYEQVMELKELYWNRPTTKRNVNLVPWQVQGGREALDVSLLNDPRARARFIAERKARNENLEARLRELGLTVPQMTADALVRTGRALSLPKEEDDHANV